MKERGITVEREEVRPEVENVVGALGFAPRHQPAPHDDPSLRERDFFANLRQGVPARLADGGGDEFRADVALGEIFLAHGEFALGTDTPTP